jgi:cell division protein FtsL
MGKAKRKRKKSQTKTKKINYTALIVAVIFTALVIFYVRGGFGALGKLLIT